MRPATSLRATTYRFENIPAISREEVALWNLYCRVGPREHDWHTWLSDLFSHMFEYPAGVEIHLSQTSLIDPGHAEKQLTFGSKRELSIGRDPDNDVVLPANAISGRHARLVVNEGRTSIVDLGTRLGTYLWDNRLPPNKPTPVSNGDQFTVFPYRFRVALDQRWSADNRIAINRCSIEPGTYAQFTKSSQPGWHSLTIEAQPTGETLVLQVDTSFVDSLHVRVLRPLGLDGIREHLPSDDTLLSFLFLAMLERANRTVRMETRFSVSAEGKPKLPDTERGMTLRCGIDTSNDGGEFRLFLPFRFLSRCLAEATPPAEYFCPRGVSWRFPVLAAYVDLYLHDIEQIVPGDILVTQRYPALAFPTNFSKGWALIPDASNSARFVVDKYTEGTLNVDATMETSGSEATKPDIQSLPLRLHVVLGEKEYTLSDIQALTPGAIVELDVAKSDPVRLMVNGKILGEGELLDVDGSLAVKVLRWRNG